MEKREILGDTVRRRIVEENYKKIQARRSGRTADADKAAPVDKVREARIKPFSRLADKQKEVIRSVRGMMADADELLMSDGIRHRGFVVVVGKHAPTEKTPDHTTVVGVTLMSKDTSVGDPDHYDWIQFMPIAIPSKLVPYFFDYPHDLLNPNLENVERFDIEIAPSPASIMQEGESVTEANRRGRASALRGQTDQVDLGQHNLRIINQLILNPDLNPHLQQLSFVFNGDVDLNSQ